MWRPSRLPYQIMFMSHNSNTTSATSGAGTANPSGAPVFTPGFYEVRVAQSLVFCVTFCRAFFPFVLLLLAIIISGLDIYVYICVASQSS